MGGLRHLRQHKVVPASAGVFSYIPTAATLHLPHTTPEGEGVTWAAHVLDSGMSPRSNPRSNCCRHEHLENSQVAVTRSRGEDDETCRSSTPQHRSAALSSRRPIPAKRTPRSESCALADTDQSQQLIKLLPRSMAAATRRAGPAPQPEQAAGRAAAPHSVRWFPSLGARARSAGSANYPGAVDQHPERTAQPRLPARQAGSQTGLPSQALLPSQGNGALVSASSNTTLLSQERDRLDQCSPERSPFAKWEVYVISSM